MPKFLEAFFNWKYYIWNIYKRFIKYQILLVITSKAQLLGSLF